MALAHRLVLSTPAAAPEPLSVRERPAFVALDAAVCNQARGAFHLEATPDVARAAMQHLARRLRAQGRTVFYGERSPARPAFADLLQRAGLPAARDTKDAVRLLTPHTQAVFLLVDLARDSWDASVLTELQPELVVLSGNLTIESTPFQLESSLGVEARALWLQGMCAELEANAPHALGALDSWLTRTVRQASVDEHPHECAAEAIAMLAAVGRPIPREVAFDALGDRLGAECIAHGIAESAGGLRFESPTHNVAIARHAARLLDAHFADDCWAAARAMILHLEANEVDAAHDALQRALAVTHDPAARREVLTTLAEHLEHAPLADDRFLLAASALALTHGEPRNALEWLRHVTRQDAEHALLQGRAYFAVGDLVAAGISLQNARTLEDSAPIAVELAELACVRGDYTLARDEANRALACDDRALALRARNVLGKILLAENAWDRADRHFAEDAICAGNAKLPTAEMRAKLNRGIALLSKGRLDDADQQFSHVLSMAEAHHDGMATLYALPNLAVAAMRKHEYGRALSLWEQAAKTLQSTHGALPEVRALVYANLAEMRILLGMYEQASHVLAFGRRGVSASDVRSAATWLDATEASLALRRGDTSAARRLATQALLEAKRIDERTTSHLALRILVRTALQDGDVNTASHLLEVDCAAASEAATTIGLAEVLVLHAALARAQGREDSLECALAALTPVRDAGDEELLIEGLTLAALAYRDRGQIELAQQSLQRAVVVRDRVASTLHSDARVSYLAKHENATLHRLLLSLSPEVEAPTAHGQTIKASPTRQLVGQAPSMASLRSCVRKVAKSSATVLIRGESGTGKELVAAALHAQSDRANGPLVTVNCAALVETLLLSELFGHEKGAFTGASARRRGRFELAEGGTLFLDEIGDISPRTQVALLRVLQERTFERVGGTTPVHANVRVVCATHRNLAAMVERGEFREDLYYRLCGVVLEVPALRNRLSDLPELAQHLLGRIAIERGDVPPTITADALELMGRHRWSGNVRELENVLRSLSLFCENHVITSADLIAHHEAFTELASQAYSVGPTTLRTLPELAPLSSRGDDSSDDLEEAPSSLIVPAGTEATPTTEAVYAHVRNGGTSLFDLKRQIERDCILLALKETGGNITRAATLLGMKRPRLSQLVKQYQLSSEES